MEGVVTIKDTQRITPLTKKGKIGIKNFYAYFSNWLSQLLHYPLGQIFFLKIFKKEPDFISRLFFI
jgi:hypothetical protein